MDTFELAGFIKPGQDDLKRLEWRGMIEFLGSPVFREISAKSRADILISLEDFDYVNADGLIWIMVLGDLLKAKGNSLWLQLPRDQHLLKQLKSSNFCDIAGSIFSFTNLYLLDEIPETRTLIGVAFSRIDLTSLRFLLPKIRNFLLVDLPKRLGTTPHGEFGFEYLQPFVSTISETSKNVVQHSRKEEDSGWGYLIISEIKQRHSSQFRFCIADAGQGFLSSLLSKGLKVSDDLDAIRHALMFRYHMKGGEGLFRTVMFTSQLNGFINIHSGSARASLDLRHTRLRTQDETRKFIETNLRVLKEGFYFPGVQIQLDVRGPGV